MKEREKKTKTKLKMKVAKTEVSKKQEPKKVAEDGLHAVDLDKDMEVEMVMVIVMKIKRSQMMNSAMKMIKEKNNKTKMQMFHLQLSAIVKSILMNLKPKD